MLNLFKKDNVELRKYVFYFNLVLLGAVLVFRLYYLQVESRERFELKSDENRIREIVTEPSRGFIFDRFGELIVDNRPSFEIRVIPNLLDSALYERLERLTGLTKGMIDEKIKGKWPYNPVTVKTRVSFSDIVKIEENKLDLPGVLYHMGPLRNYPNELDMGHILGYLSEISEDKIDVYKKDGYRIGNLIGTNGLEKTYEKDLRGVKGVYFMEVDSKGREIREVGQDEKVQPVDGYNLYLTIDQEMQKLAKSLMAGKRGAIVVLDARNGEILTAVSQPDFSPNLFSGGISQENWEKLNSDPEIPLYNRLVQGLYPPGSVYKMVTLSAGLEDGIVTPEWSVFCPGYFVLGRRTFKCWELGGHGTVSACRALRVSCDVYFYQLGLKIGIERLARFSHIYGFDRPTNVGIPNEKEGIIPTIDFLNKRYGKNEWREEGAVVNLAIGQGEVLVNIMQVAQYFLMIANNGIHYQPHLVRFKATQFTAKKIVAEPKQLSEISDETLKIIRAGMWDVMNSDEGTGRAGNHPGVKSGGKTGTAQNSAGPDLEHAWFGCFSPFDDPEIVIVVLTENGGEGSKASAPVAAKILNYYFEVGRHKKAVEFEKTKTEKYPTLSKAEIER